MITSKNLTTVKGYLMDACIDFIASCDDACSQCCHRLECENFKNAMTASFRALRKFTVKIAEE